MRSNVFICADCQKIFKKDTREFIVHVQSCQHYSPLNSHKLCFFWTKWSIFIYFLWNTKIYKYFVTIIQNYSYSWINILAKIVFLKDKKLKLWICLNYYLLSLFVATHYFPFLSYLTSSKDDYSSTWLWNYCLHIFFAKVFHEKLLPSFIDIYALELFLVEDFTYKELFQVVFGMFVDYFYSNIWDNPFQSFLLFITFLILFFYLKLLPLFFTYFLHCLYGYFYNWFTFFKLDC